jgi:hypothetical protein
MVRVRVTGDFCVSITLFPAEFGEFFSEILTIHAQPLGYDEAYMLSDVNR